MAKETKEEKFKRLAEARVDKTLKMMRLVGNLSNPNFYESEPEDWESIIKALEKGVEEIKERIMQPAGKKKFTLNDPE